MPQPNRLSEKQQIDWLALFYEALRVEGSVTDIYSRFYNYSFGNCMLLRLQGVREPVNTLKRWNAMNRRVLRGSSAYSIMVPLVYKTTDDEGEERRVLRGFKISKCLFGVSQTEGDELPEAEPREWSKERALGKLAITENPYDLLEGNTQGVSWDRNIAINPVAAFPMKTWLHEVSHVVAGHTTDEAMNEYRQHRGLYELEAEASAYILMNELGIAEADDLAESRTYIRHWIGEREVPEANIRRTFVTADAILRAGRLAVEGGEDG
jgi:hypothetical protein